VLNQKLIYLVSIPGICEVVGWEIKRSKQFHRRCFLVIA
jgi:hypothetical protein